ncbi:hypothetical protein TSAR_011390 [Trichomalopsis sarcophagae]|uniref:Uncharacterized protein n=1 Tax=Trichomalopsis sarcophagae TaxID=543379 RepID=A0A232FFM3_9HYME|nr:hypothetical protein TSAR_011390 [Trichomalopsis sarcophagae]
MHYCTAFFLVHQCSDVIVDRPTGGARAEVLSLNSNTLDRTAKPVDVTLPPTLPMTFGTENSTVIHAQSGSTAHLPCVVHNIGEGMSKTKFRSDDNLKRYLKFSVDGIEKLRRRGDIL